MTTMPDVPKSSRSFAWTIVVSCLVAWSGCSDDAMMVLDAATDAATDGATGRDAPDGASPTRDGSVASMDGSSYDAGPVARSAGCGTEQEARFECFEEMFEGRMRSWCLNVAEGYEPNHVYELVIGLHGCGGNNQAVHNHRAPMEAEGATEFLFVYPQAADSCWDYQSAIREGNDASFIQHMVGQAQSMTCLNTERTFVHGMSSGGSMAPRVVNAGIAIAFGCASGAGNVPSPTPAWYFAGRSDGSYGVISGSARQQVALNRCSMETTPIEGTPCVRYEGCSAPMVYCEDDRGHVWPREEWAQGGILEVFRATP